VVSSPVRRANAGISGFANPETTPTYFHHISDGTPLCGKKPINPGRKTLIEARKLFRRTEPALNARGAPIMMTATARLSP
jgi:hypothetical protein